MKVWFAALAFLWMSSSAWSFPEMIRHGYVNCNSCHLSPSGGGALTLYGRELSKEALSTWSEEGEQYLAHGLLGPEVVPEWLIIGGDARAVQTYHDTPSFREADWIWMQADVEIAAQYKGFSASITPGLVHTGTESSFGVRKFYGMWNATDSIAVRAGKFLPNYGLNIPDHYVSTRSLAGLSHDVETANIEFGWTTEHWNLTTTGAFALTDENELATSRSKALFQDVSFSNGTTDRIGISAMWADSDNGFTYMYGAHVAIGITDKLFVLGEGDLKWSPKDLHVRTDPDILRYIKVGYEVVKGLSPYVTYDGSRAGDNFGIGAQWFPRPHLEVSAQWEKSKYDAFGSGMSDFAYILFHYYL